MSVKATLTSIHSNRATDSTVTRKSNERIHVDIEVPGDGTNVRIEIVAREDGRTYIEVKRGQTVTQVLDLSGGYLLTHGSAVIDGESRYVWGDQS